MNWNGFVILVVFLTPYNNCELFLSESYFHGDEGNLLKKAIVFVVQKFYIDKILYVTMLTTDKSMGCHYGDIISEVLFEADCVSWYLEYFGEFQTGTLRYYNIIIIDSYEAFLILADRLKNVNIYDTTGYYLIVLLGSRSNHYLIMQKILVLCWNIFIVNVNILVEPLQGLAFLYSYYPYTPLHCGYVVPVIVNNFMNGTMKHEDLFPKKFENLHNCTLTVVTWENPPFIFITQNTSICGHLGGIEGNVLENLAQTMNFSFKLVAPPMDNPRGYIFENGSSTGSFGMLSKNKANLTIGCYRYSEQRVKNFGSTHPYYQVPLVIAMTKGASYGSMERLLYPFTATIWIFIGILFILAIVTIGVLRNIATRETEFFVIGYNNTMPLYNMWISSFGGQTNYSPKRNFARFILFLWIWVTLVIRNSYQGALYDFLKSNTDKEELNTLADMADAGYYVHIDPPTLELVQDNENLRKMYKVSIESQHEFLFKLQKGLSKAGILCPHDYVTYFNNVNYKNGILHILKERVVIQPVAIYFKKNSFLIEPFSEYLWTYSRSGLLGKWVSDFIATKYSRSALKNSPRKLSNEQLYGAYNIYLILIGVACFSFAIEVLSPRFKSLRKFVKICTM